MTPLRRHLRRLGCALALTDLLACKPRQPCAQGDPLPVQMLATASPELNPCRNGAACAVNLQIYELKSGADLDELDYDALHERGGEVFGQNLVKPPIDRALYADERRPWAFELDPATTHVVTVALFSEVLGDAWYNVYAVPRDHSERACEARRRGETLGDPCIYLAFDGYEVNGGRYPPAGFDMRDFDAVCAPVMAAPTKKKKRRRKRPGRSVPQPPSAPSPSVPSTPSAPSAPSTPSAPSLPRP